MRRLPPEITRLADRRHGRFARLKSGRFKRLKRWSRRQDIDLILFALVAVAVVASVLTHHWPFSIGVIDGDTVRYHFRTVRLIGFDTPESGTRARCEFERLKAQQATKRLRELIAAARKTELTLQACACPPGTENRRACNYGRACGVLTVDGRDVGTILIIEGLARPYQCGLTSCPPRRSWC